MQPGVWSFSRSAYSNFKKSPWIYVLSVSILNPGAVIRGGYQFHYKLSITCSWLWQENKKFMKNCDDFLSPPRIAANFMWFWSCAFFKLHSALYCPIIGAVALLRKSAVKSCKPHKMWKFWMFHNAENVYQQYTNLRPVDFAGKFCLNLNILENARKCPKLVPIR